MQDEKMNPNRSSVVRFLDRSIQLGLLATLVVLPLGFPRFLVLFPLEIFPFSSMVPKEMLVSFTPLNLKESLATLMAIYVMSLWLIRVFVSGRLSLIWTPLHLPFLIIVGLAGLSLVEPVSLLMQLRDFGLLISYCCFVHLFLLYGYSFPVFRRRSMVLFLLVGGVFTLIVFCMKQGFYFRPFVSEVQDRRQALYATIGHNISVASYLMLLSLYLLGRITLSRSWWVRILYGLWLMICIDLIIAAQTVGVWFALIGLVFAVLVMVFYYRGRLLQKQAIRWVLIASGVILILFCGLFTFNEMLGHGGNRSTPMERLKMRVDPDVLKTGTRMRLWMISADMIRRQFPFGIGFSGFKYRYSDEQARYFRENPDTYLIPTPKHTDRVHNEFLQIGLELGAPGFIVLLWGLFVFLRMQGRVLCSARLSGRQKLWASNAFLALLGTLFHLVTSFEFHIVTTALFFIFGLNLWINDGRLGRRYSCSLSNLSRPLFGVIFFSMLTGLAGLGFSMMACRHVVADAYFWVGESFRDVGNLGRAIEYLDRSRQLAPYRGQVAKQQGALLFSLGEQYCLQNNPEQGLLYLRKADDILTESLKTYRHKDQYFYRAKCRQLIGAISGRPEMMDLAVQDYLRVIEVYPQDLKTYYELGKLYYSANKVSQALEVWEKAREYDPEFIDKYHVKDAEFAIQKGRKDIAIQYYQLTLLLDPRNGKYYRPLMELFMETRRYSEGIRLGKAFLDLFPKEYWMMSEIAEMEFLSGDRQAPPKWLGKLLALDTLTTQAAQVARDCYLLMDRKEEIQPLLERWLEDNRDHLFAREEMGLLVTLDDVYREKGMDEERETLWKEILSLPDDQLWPFYRNRALSRLGRLYVEQARMTEGLDCFKQAVQIPIKKNQYSTRANVELLTLYQLPLVF